jgi:hypothetical protein
MNSFPVTKKRKRSQSQSNKEEKSLFSHQHCDDNKKRTTIAFIIAKGDKLNATSWAIVVDFKSIEYHFCQFHNKLLIEAGISDHSSAFLLHKKMEKSTDLLELNFLSTF